jgi:hypothetical protein
VVTAAEHLIDGFESSLAADQLGLHYNTNLSLTHSAMATASEAISGRLGTTMEIAAHALGRHPRVANIEAPVALRRYDRPMSPCLTLGLFRPSASSLRATYIDVDGRAKSGHNEGGASAALNVSILAVSILAPMGLNRGHCAPSNDRGTGITDLSRPANARLEGRRSRCPLSATAAPARSSPRSACA